MYCGMEEVNFHDININNHRITIWADRFVVLRHPEKCDLYYFVLFDSFNGCTFVYSLSKGNIQD